jgi:SAM-dependent MidA family methyltransferase
MASAIPPEFLATFRQTAGDGGAMSFARFMELALYHPDTGYYAKRRRRIGRAPDTDFFTATSLGPVFGELVVAACVTLLEQRPPRDHTFVEIGTEPQVEGAAPSAPLGYMAALRARRARRPPVPGGSQIASNDQGTPGSVLAGMAHPFASAATISLGQPLQLPSRAVVFSNELFDAQPCHRLVRMAGRWREGGVGLRDEALEEILLPELTPEVQAALDRLPAAAPDGYRIDLPLAAAQLAERIAAQPWVGLFVAFDYGKSWRELAEDTPAGTVRAYLRHEQSNDLLAHPGGQDLTCHVCWDWLSEALTAHGFAAPVLESQEAFFVHHAAPALSRLTAAEAGRFSGRKLGVMQLLHPGNMGQKFQVLWARRD